RWHQPQMARATGRRLAGVLRQAIGELRLSVRYGLARARPPATGSVAHPAPLGARDGPRPRRRRRGCAGQGLVLSALARNGPVLRRGHSQYAVPRPAPADLSRSTLPGPAPYARSGG